ncbi:MAG: sigma-70 family RNA polymerase sigma factor [Bacteroidetes bacterium]|nr:sigma-70 family RNA polymerase sigma factor [Bacteroidota bacterium]
MNLTEAIQSVDMDEVIDRMNAYAISLLKSVGVKNFNGKEPIDFVGDVILKVMEGKRDWAKAQCSFKEFLFGCLKSEINNFFTTNKNIYEDELPDVPSNEQSLNVEDKRNQVSELLKQEGADDDELTVFECWADGITKPAEIAKDLGIDVKEVYKITKRLERRLPKIQTQVTNVI